ncbi:Lysine-specific demethylase 3B [Hordeum vulgare]|nr:Lysine-specific demethylase 3B [Hordeum vulgare]
MMMAYGNLEGYQIQHTKDNGSASWDEWVARDRLLKLTEENVRKQLELKNQSGDKTVRTGGRSAQHNPKASNAQIPSWISSSEVDKWKVSREDKIKFSHRTIYFLLPWLKNFHHEQMQEKIVEATIKGIDACEVKVPQANCAKNERIFCNNCRTSIVDFHRSCDKCSYDLCLICCRELRLGRCPGGAAASNTVLTQPEVEGKEDLQQTRSDDNAVSQKIPDGQNGLLRNSGVPVDDSAAVASTMVLTQPEVEGKEYLEQTSSDDNSVSQKLSDR